MPSLCVLNTVKLKQTLSIFYVNYILLTDDSWLAPDSSPRHIIVQVRGRIFSCVVLDENMEPLSPAEIER